MAANGMSCLSRAPHSVLLRNIEVIAPKTTLRPLRAAYEGDDQVVTQRARVISRERYSGHEINRREEDRIGKRRGRYGDNGGVIAHGGYVGLSRETRTGGSGFWGRREVVGDPQRCVREQLNL